MPMDLADGSTVFLGVYEATVEWDGHLRHIPVHMEGGALLGMSLLYGSRLVIDVVDGGAVTIDALP